MPDHAPKIWTRPEPKQVKRKPKDETPAAPEPEVEQPSAAEPEAQPELEPAPPQSSEL